MFVRYWYTTTFYVAWIRALLMVAGTKLKSIKDKPKPSGGGGANRIASFVDNARRLTHLVVQAVAIC